MQVITFTDANDMVARILIENVYYLMRITWNSKGNFWTFHLWDSDSIPLVTNIRITTNFPLLINKHCFNIPKGEFMVISDYTELNRDSFLNDQAVLTYITKDEWDLTPQ